MFLSIGMLKQKYFLADIFILSAEKQPIKLSWRKIECLPLLYVLIIVSILLAMLPLFFNNPTFVDPERGIESTLGVFHLSIGYYLWIGSFLTLLLGEIVLFFQK